MLKITIQKAHKRILSERRTQKYYSNEMDTQKIEQI